MKNIFVLIFVSLFGFGSMSLYPKLVTAQQSQQIDKKYVNTRFGYSINYPANILIAQEEAPNGDGRKFVSKDSRTEMIVYGAHNPFDYTLKKMYDSELKTGEFSPSKKGAITYKIIKGNWFVISGLKDGKVFYKKTFLTKENTILTFLIKYPKSQKSVYDPVTAKIAQSFSSN